jgi:hypothetical protein
VHADTYDGQHVWFASGDKLNAFDPVSVKTLRSIAVTAHAGTAFSLYGLRSKDALLLFTSNGTELCSWVICQRPSTFR